jgi:hypothetical protein
MRQTLAEIAQAAERLRSHPFFSRLRPDADLRKMLAFAPSGTFWVMSFQDIIFMNAELTTDPVIRSLVERHRQEDTGHEHWFLADIASVFGAAPTRIDWLFSEQNRQVRTVAYALASEVFHIQDDVLRLVLLEVLEAAAGVYFAAISSALTAAGHAGSLKYFAGEHLTAEADHEMHGESNNQIETMSLSVVQRGQAKLLIDRMFARFFQLGDALLECFDEARAGAPSSFGDSSPTKAQ